MMLMMSKREGEIALEAVYLIKKDRKEKKKGEKSLLSDDQISEKK